MLALEAASSTKIRPECLFFVTQGLDLAIPSSHDYKKGLYLGCERWSGIGEKDGSRKGSVDFIIKDHVFEPVRPVLGMDDETQQALFSKMCPRTAAALPAYAYDAGDVRFSEVWHSHPIPSQAEAVCARVVCPGGGEEAVGCATRILRKEEGAWLSPSAPSTADVKMISAQERRPNLLVVMIDPMSRAHLLRTLPRTAMLLEKYDFVDFANYSAVGFNSGPNQAAFYAGAHASFIEETSKRRRRPSRRSAAPSSAKEENKPAPTRRSLREGEQQQQRVWLWEQLRDKLGYRTLKVEDGCVENSNMVQSIITENSTDHGSQLKSLFCFDFSRPNCLGTRAAVKILLDYVREFFKVYAPGGGGTTTLPVAAFVHLIDSHEDSMILGTIVDAVVADFLEKIISNLEAEPPPGAEEWNSNAQQRRPTVFVVTSDHGIHYGPFFSTPLGQSEHIRPFLFVKTVDPDGVFAPALEHRGWDAIIRGKTASEEDVGTTTVDDVLRLRRSRVVTPFDAHATLVDLLERLPEGGPAAVPEREQTAPAPGVSLLDPAAPDRACDVLASVAPLVHDRSPRRSVCGRPRLRRSQSGQEITGGSPHHSSKSSTACLVPSLDFAPSAASYYADVEARTSYFRKDTRVLAARPANFKLHENAFEGFLYRVSRGPCFCASMKQGVKKCELHGEFVVDADEAFAIVACKGVEPEFFWWAGATPNDPATAGQPKKIVKVGVGSRRLGAGGGTAAPEHRGRFMKRRRLGVDKISGIANLWELWRKEAERRKNMGLWSKTDQKNAAGQLSPSALLRLGVQEQASNVPPPPGSSTTATKEDKAPAAPASPPTAPDKSLPPPNIFILELDSVSRKAFRRHFPKTSAYLGLLGGRADHDDTSTAAAPRPSRAVKTAYTAVDFQAASVVGVHML